ncbi:MAG: DUF86 domain-containing protein [Saprospiraceae bacterium]|nr:DUF86 domain-containing protein [Candidatus Opimibacter skivensis]
MSRREPLLLVSDILESGRKILDYTAGMDFDSFTKDEKTIDAVIRNFQIIGEAANRLPDEFREQHSEVDWYRIRGFRNRIIHHYFGIDLEIVWHIKETYLPGMIATFEAIQK